MPLAGVGRPGCYGCLLAMLALFIQGHLVPKAWAAENKDAVAKGAIPQNVGGLLFDVDEGVRVEQGPGGSVYVKSNRKFMEEKFSQIDERLHSLEERVGELESVKKRKTSASVLPEEKENARQVLVA